MAKTFKRLNDEVDLDEFISALIDGDSVDSYFRNTKVKSKDIELVKLYVNLLTKAIQLGGIEYVIDDKGRKGFTNTSGYNNLDDLGNINDKLWGYAAHYVISKLNQLNPYQAPEDTSKIKWSDSAVLTAINRYLQNSDNFNVDYFLSLDNDITSTSNRASEYKKALEHVRDYWDELFEGYTDKLKNDTLKSIEDAFATVFNDNSISKNEWQALKRITGLDNYDLLFTTTFLTDVAKDTESKPKSRTREDKIKWVMKKYKPYRGEKAIMGTGILPNDVPFGPSTELIYLNNIKNTSTQDLLKAINDIAVREDPSKISILNGCFIGKDGKPNSPSFYIGYILEDLKNRQDSPLKDIGGGSYYVEGLDTDRGTGYIWNGSMLLETNLLEIPYKVNQINQEWDNMEEDDEFDQELYDTLYRSLLFKSGGIIKAETGANSRSFTNINTRKNYNYNDTNKVFSSNETVDWLDQVFGGDIDKYKDFVENNINLRYSSGINKYNNDPSVVENSEIGKLNTSYQSVANNDKLTLNGILYGNSLDDYLNQKGLAYNLYGEFIRPDNAISGDNYEKGYVDSLPGSQTFFRVASLTDKNINNFGRWGDYWQNKGAVGAYYKEDADGYGQWIPVKDWSAARDVTNFKPFVSVETDDTITIKDNPNNYKLGLLAEAKNGTVVEDTSNAYIKGLNYVQNYMPDMIGTGRYLASLRANDKVANILKRPLTAVLKNTYEKYSPITGNFGELSQSYKDAADIESLGSTIAQNTSDASLGAAVKLEAKKQADLKRVLGRLADDKEIMRTKAEALARMEDNMAKRAEIANFNRKAINDVEREIALVDSTKVKSNWQSFDNLMAEMLIENKKAQDTRKEFDYQVAADEGLAYKRRIGNVVYDKYLSWQKIKGNETKTLADFYLTPEGKKAKSWLDEADNLNISRLRVALALLYGGYYNDPYNGIYNIDFSKTYKFKNGSKLIFRKRRHV